MLEFLSKPRISKTGLHVDFIDYSKSGATGALMNTKHLENVFYPSRSFLFEGESFN